MTVGIAALSIQGSHDTAILAADRMVSIGRGDGIEYEDTESKIEPFIHNDQLVAAAVGAGPSAYIDEVLETLHTLIATEGSNLSTMRMAMEFSKYAYKRVLQRSVNNQIFGPLDYNLQDLKDEDVHIPDQLQSKFLQQALELRNRYTDSVQILIAGVGRDGGGIYQLAGGDYTNYTDRGYAVIGSGSRSARLTFTRRQYSHSESNPEECLFTVAEAKVQSEERQGVGNRMDIFEIKQGMADEYNPETLENLREQLNEVEVRERNAREKVIGDWDT